MRAALLLRVRAGEGEENSAVVVAAIIGNLCVELLWWVASVIGGGVGVVKFLVLTISNLIIEALWSCKGLISFLERYLYGTKPGIPIFGLCVTALHKPCTSVDDLEKVPVEIDLVLWQDERGNRATPPHSQPAIKFYVCVCVPRVKCG